jgi:hypothetical protein
MGRLNSDDACFLAGSHWEVVGDVYRVALCRPGFVIVRGARPEADQCFPCPANRYLADPASYYAAEGEPWLVAATADEAARMCRSSEAGLLCMGGDAVITQEGFWRLEKPVKIRRAHDDTDLSTDRQGRRAMHASHVYTNKSSVAGAPGTYLRTYERNAAGAPASQVADRPRVQPSVIKVFRCAAGVCLVNGTCSPGRHGPVCGLCLPEYVRSLSGCVKCTDPEGYERGRPAAIVLTLFVFLVAWFLTSWWPLVFESGLQDAFWRLMSRLKLTSKPKILPWNVVQGNVPRMPKAATSKAFKLFSNGGTVYIKNCIGFYQLVASLGVTFHEVDWGNMSAVLADVNVFNFEIFSFPSISCLTGGLGFMTKLLIITIVPGGVCILLAMPPAFLKLLERVYKKRHRSHDRIFESFYHWLNIWLFLMYLPASMVCLSAFHCRQYGDDWLLVSDMREVRPLFARSLGTCMHVRVCVGVQNRLVCTGTS